jgi:glyoxylase-like metal-dependent hydrolase (beta-lactamase superfamily II)
MATLRRVVLAYNSIYVVDDGNRRVLIDTGPDYRGSFDIALEAVRRQLPDLVVATHGHLDHAGLGSRWLAAGVPVGIGAADAHLVHDPGQRDVRTFETMAAFARTSGAPADVIAEVMSGLEQRREWSRRASQERDYRPGGSGQRWPTGLRFEPFEPSVVFEKDSADAGCGLVVLQTPGHTPGNTVLVHEGEGWLFSGDQLLPEITPTPAIQPLPPGQGEGTWRFHSLPHFVASLKRLAALHLTRCFPGHGEPFGDVAGAIATNLAAIEQRTDRVLSEFRELHDATLYEVAEGLYPRAVRRRFWQIISTVQGHLDLLEADGAIVACEDGYRYID